MYRAFRIKVDDDFRSLTQERSLHLRNSEAAEAELLSSAESDIKSKLANVIGSVSLDFPEISAESLWDEWFPEIEADIFISHSSKDVRLANDFAAWLRAEHGLACFIDSGIWGHADDLLRELDNEFCLKPDQGTYNYQKRNGTTAHVHMLLAYALTRMIDQAECFIFLESHHSITAKNAAEHTYSPWIFHELATVDTIQRKRPTRMAHTLRRGPRRTGRNLKLKYPILDEGLVGLDSFDLDEWTSEKQASSRHSLDILYNMV